MGGGARCTSKGLGPVVHPPGFLKRKMSLSHVIPSDVGIVDVRASVRVWMWRGRAGVWACAHAFPVPRVFGRRFSALLAFRRSSNTTRFKLRIYVLCGLSAVKYFKDMLDIHTCIRLYVLFTVVFGCTFHERATCNMGPNLQR